MNQVRNFITTIWETAIRIMMDFAEWGAHAVLESVRDARVAVWDEVGDPTNFDAADCKL